MSFEGLIDDVKRLAFRSPSVHNVQPWLLRLRDGEFVVYEDLDRTLKAGDPNLNDHRMSLGAFVEGLRLIASRHGFKLVEAPSEGEAPLRHKGKTLRSAFRLRVVSGQVFDSLYDRIHERRSFRGVFKACGDADRSKLAEYARSARAVALTSPPELREWARLCDEATLRVQSDPRHQKELYQWLRLTSDHPLYSEDGLNREALSISRIEGRLARRLLDPPVYKALDRLGLAKLIVSEARQIRSSAGLVILFKDGDQSAFERGRSFYRFWLGLTSLGFAACPVSALVDDKISRERILKRDSREPYAAMRVGVAGDDLTYESPRRPLEQVWIGD